MTIFEVLDVVTCILLLGCLWVREVTRLQKEVSVLRSELEDGVSHRKLYRSFSVAGGASTESWFEFVDYERTAINLLIDCNSGLLTTFRLYKLYTLKKSLIKTNKQRDQLLTSFLSLITPLERILYDL